MQVPPQNPLNICQSWWCTKTDDECLKVYDLHCCILFMSSNSLWDWANQRFSAYDRLLTVNARHEFLNIIRKLLITDYLKILLMYVLCCNVWFATVRKECSTQPYATRWIRTHPTHDVLLWENAWVTYHDCILRMRTNATDSVRLEWMSSWKHSDSVYTIKAVNCHSLTFLEWFDNAVRGFAFHQVKSNFGWQWWLLQLPTMMLPLNRCSMVVFWSYQYLTNWCCSCPWLTSSIMAPKLKKLILVQVTLLVKLFITWFTKPRKKQARDRGINASEGENTWKTFANKKQECESLARSISDNHPGGQGDKSISIDKQPSLLTG